MFFGKVYSTLNLGSNDILFKKLRFWSIEGFAKIYSYRFIGDRSGTFIFKIDIMMIIFILKHSMNTKNLGPLEKLHLAPRLDSDKTLNNTREYTCS